MLQKVKKVLLKYWKHITQFIGWICGLVGGIILWLATVLVVGPYIPSAYIPGMIFLMIPMIMTMPGYCIYWAISTTLYQRGLKALSGISVNLIIFYYIL